MISYGRLRPGSIDEAAFKIRRLWDEEERQRVTGWRSAPPWPGSTSTHPSGPHLVPVVAPPEDRVMPLADAPRVVGGRVVAGQSAVGTAKRPVVSADAATLALGLGAAAITAAPAWLPGLLGAVGLGLLLSGDTPRDKEKEEEERCREAADKCREECSEILPTRPRWDQGMPFHRCVNECLQDEGCPNALGADGRY
jgi:hypothetical protein